MICKSDPATYLWNGTITGDRTCLLVKTGENGTPAHAFIRKMPSRGETVVDKQTGGEEYHVKRRGSYFSYTTVSFGFITPLICAV